MTHVMYAPPFPILSHPNPPLALLLSGKWDRTSFTKHVYGATCEEWDDTLGSLVQRNPLPAQPGACPELLGTAEVAAITLFAEHTCTVGPLSPSEGSAFSTSSTASAPSSAGALLKKGTFGRRIPCSHLVTAIRPEYERRGATWKGTDVYAEIKKVDPGANMQMAFHVLRKLRSPVLLTPHYNTMLLQGMATALRQEGFGVVLHYTNATSVKLQIEDIARKQYAAYCRKYPENKKVPFSLSKLSSLLDKYSSAEAERLDYVVGWTLVPPNMMHGRLHSFVPVDAFDGANMRGNAAGTMFIRATKDANDNIHPISISILLATEGTLATDAVQTAERLALGPSSALDMPGRVTITDGGKALMNSQLKAHPLSSLWRCEHHLKGDLAKRCKASLPIYEQLIHLPRGRVVSADECFSKLPASSPLHRIPKEQICQSYMNPDSCLHGNLTNNMAEICNHMLSPARTQQHLFNSMLAAVHVLKRRHVCALMPQPISPATYLTCHGTTHLLTTLLHNAFHFSSSPVGWTQPHNRCSS